MSFDWIGFLQREGIDYDDEGETRKHTAGNIGISCPFCGRDDSNKMGIHLGGRGWSCWKNGSHKGRHPAPLIAALLGITLPAARALVDDEKLAAPPDTVDELLTRLDGLDEEEHVEHQLVRYQDTFIEARRSRKAQTFLRTRRFEPSSFRAVCDRYHLKVDRRDPRWKDRLIIPIWDQGLRGWTARSWDPDEPLRYDAAPSKKDGGTLHAAIFNADQPRNPGSSILYIVEGPLDAMMVDWTGYKLGWNAVATMGTNPSPARISSLIRMLRASNYENVVIVFDREAEGEALALQEKLAVVGARLAWLPAGVDDPADMGERRCRGFFDNLSAVISGRKARGYDNMPRSPE